VLKEWAQTARKESVLMVLVLKESVETPWVQTDPVLKE
jgi:hypothetical protein